MTSAESAELGSILKRLVPAVKFATGAHRVYFLALMERVALPPLARAQEKGGRLRGVAYLAAPPVPASGTAAAAISKKIAKRFEES